MSSKPKTLWKTVSPASFATQTGGSGDDIFYVFDSDDVVFEAPGGGNDIVYTTVNYTLAAGQEIETLASFSQGSTSALVLVGNEFNQTINGNAGNNYLDGGSGADTLVGFGGDDSYVVDGVEDYVAEFAGGGNDTVYVRGSFSLGAGQEVEILAAFSQAGTAPIVIVGNGGNQILYGNAGANYLDGGSGNDTLVGFGGNDSYVVDDANDYVAEFAGGGNDIVYVRGSFSLGAGQEVETLAAFSQAGTAPIVIVGNNIAQTLYGNAGNNYLDGGGGIDVLQGFGGNDTYLVDNAGDFIVEVAGEGNDIVYALASFTLTAGQEIEILSAVSQAETTALNLSGNEFANTLYGNAGANVLNGGGGGDFLQGFGGADTFAFTSALGGGNIDTILDFNVADDTIALAGAPGDPFAALASGALSAASFVIGSAALDANDYLIYNSGTGALLYDADGNGAGAAVQFATLGTGLALTAADFVVSGPANTAPSITSGSTASVVENSPTSTIVYQAQANDAQGDRITYSLTGADAGLLTIDANGAVRLLASPDYETRTSYNFSVVASDSGLSNSQAVTLSVIDVNDSVSTPIINETVAANDTMGTAQFVDRTTFLVANNNFLPNDDLPSATIQGSIASTNDRDFYSITLQQGELLILDVDFTNGGLDSHVFVQGPSGNPLGDNDDQGAFDAGSTGIATTHNTDSYFQFRAPAAGTYYFYIQSFQGGSAGDYKINVSIGPPASAALIFEEDVAALISGSSWNHTNLTYGFPQLASQYPDNPTFFDGANPDEEFQPFTAGQQAATRQLLQLVANVSSLTFTELTGGIDPTSGAGSADLRYAMSTDMSTVEGQPPAAAYAYYPTNGGPSSPGGSSWYNTTSFNTPLKGNYAWMGILHETGHALGLEHAHEDAPTVSPGHDSVEYTVMTYRAYVGDGLEGGYGIEQFGFPQTLMMLDIGALQKMYGANFAFNSGDSVYSWNSSTGEMSINGAGQGAPGNGAGGMQNRVFLTIWDGGGTDTYDMTNYASGVTIDLRPGEWSITSAEQLANLRANGGPVYARGNVANALQYLGSEASLIENAVGGAGNDSLTANEASNGLTGNGGIDTFKWMARADGGDTGAAADIIADFLRGTDKIDLAGVDANSATEANDAFSFIDTAAFSGTAGQLRYQVEGAHLRIQGDTDGNGISDFEIIVSNNTILATTDFIL